MKNSLSTFNSDMKRFLIKAFLFLLPLMIIFMIVNFSGKDAGKLFLKLKNEEKSLKIPPKGKNEFRVFCYGGSVVQGEPEAQLGAVAQLKFFLSSIMPERTVKIFNFSDGGRPSTYTCRQLYKTIDHSPDAVIILTGNNEFLDPYNAEEVQNISLLLETKIDSFGIIRLFRRIYWHFHRPKIWNEPKEKLHPYDRNSLTFKYKKKAYYNNISLAIKLTRKYNVPLFLCTVPSNLKEWSPCYISSELKNDDKNPHFDRAMFFSYATHDIVFENKIDEIKKNIDSRKYLIAEKIINSELKKYPDDATLFYLLGRVYLLQNKNIKALKYFRMAKDLDPFPSRTLSDFNDFLRKQKKLPGVSLVDLESIFRAHSIDGITGLKLIGDNCHPTIEGNFLIARSLIATMGKSGLIRLNEKDMQTINMERFKKSIDFPELYFQALKEEGMYCQLVPHLKYRLARKYLEKALKLKPKSWEIWANLASASLFTDNIKEGKMELNKALKFKKSPFTSDDIYSVRYMHGMLNIAGIKNNFEDL